MGLHNISGSHGNEIEKAYQAKLETTAAHHTSDEENGEQNTPQRQIIQHNVQSKKRKQPSPNSEKKQCISISCGQEFRFWTKHKSLSAYSIPVAGKQCQRCTNYCTAMKAALRTLQHFSTFDESNGQNMLVKLRTIKQSGRIQYNSLMDMLHEYHPTSELFGKARFINKKRLSEKSKKICHILITLFQQNIHSHNTSFASAITDMVDRIQSSLTRISRNAADDKLLIRNIKE